MAKRPARDPGAPRRNMSAYLMYQNAMRDQFKAINPGMTFGELAKFTSKCYSELPESEKNAWVIRAEQDKARYLRDLASYIPPPGYDSKGDAIVSQVEEKFGRKVKQERDPNAPKRNTSAYLMYQNAMRDQFKRENPGMTFGQLSKYTSVMYKEMHHEEKALWETRSQMDKMRYDRELLSYVPPPGHDSRGVLIDDHRPKRRAKRSQRDPSAPKRASGAYVFFTNEMRPQVLHEFPGIKFVELGKTLGERWRALTPEQKKRFEDMAIADKDRFQNDMRQYNIDQTQAVDQAAAQIHFPSHGTTIPQMHTQMHEHVYFQDPNVVSTYEYTHQDAQHHDPYAHHPHHHYA